MRVRLALVGGALLTAACTAAPPIYFHNPESGLVVEGCSSLPGFALAVEQAESHCIKAFEEDGWIELPRAGNPASNSAR